MNELQILFDIEGEKIQNEEQKIRIISTEKDMDYKFLIGKDGIWNKLKDYSEDRFCKWVPEKEGKYTVMVQGKNKKSDKPFDFLSKEEVFINSKEELEIIKDVKIDRTKIFVGEKINIQVISSISPLLYRFWIKGGQGWEPIRDYSVENKLIYTATEEGTHEILIECKRINSTDNCEEFTTVIINVSERNKVEILDFKCLTEELVVNNELIFKVETNLGDKRAILYKFMKMNQEGKIICLQDYSSKRMISFKEKYPGQYKILCLAKDLLSNKEYDDRAILYYDIEPYKKISINRLWTDLNSPQLLGNEINIKVLVSGGREVIYRFIVEGPISEDSGYIRSSSYSWRPTMQGKYKIIVYSKDISFPGEYEAKKELEYIVDKKGNKPVRIKEVILDPIKNIIVNKPVNIKVSASGGICISYAFIVYKCGKEIERIDYGLSNWVDFIPEEKGEYSIEVKVKDKYSTKDYDSNMFVSLKVYDYLPANIDCILIADKENYMVGDLIQLEAITENTEKTLVKFNTKINGTLVEDTGYVKNKKLIIKPKCTGKYTFEVFAKNIKCLEEFDNKKEISIYVVDSLKVCNTKLKLSKSEVKLNSEVTFSVNSEGGKDVCYQFYIMENGNWIKVQEYSRKNYYTFIPFLKGRYRIMVMSKSFYKNVNYEDYDELIFNVV
ncbi:MAG: triple tyrosine motif-containing protein [Clostridiales bacterium]|nr:triple tyrosine motif-containing protein [Clostridiales bacterium]